MEFIVILKSLLNNSFDELQFKSDLIMETFNQRDNNGGYWNDNFNGCSTIDGCSFFEKFHKKHKLTGIIFTYMWESRSDRANINFLKEVAIKLYTKRFSIRIIKPIEFERLNSSTKLVIESSTSKHIMRLIENEDLIKNLSSSFIEYIEEPGIYENADILRKRILLDLKRHKGSSKRII